jgi:transglutaminase-like putative cysteine protease
MLADLGSAPLMERFLRPTSIIDSDHPDVVQLAHDLEGDSGNPVQVAQRCFEWVRDAVQHSHDFERNPVTCAASEVVRHRTGYCYAKSHLLAALLRANGIPAGLCYQRFRWNDDSTRYVLHGLNAVLLPGHGWVRVDARGNRADVDAQFTPPVEKLAFTPAAPGEVDYPDILAEPLDVVVRVLRGRRTWNEVWQNLPDVDPEEWPSIVATPRD